MIMRALERLERQQRFLCLFLDPWLHGKGGSSYYTLLSDGFIW